MEITMYNENLFHTDINNNVIVTDDEGNQINYGWLRLITSESGRMLVTDIRNYGYVVEAFGEESLSMEPFDGRANFHLTIEIGERGESNFVRLWPVLNEDVDYLCRLLTVETGNIVEVSHEGHALATYDSHELKEQSHNLDYFNSEATPDVLEATTWPRLEMDFDLAANILSESIRDELRDHAFGDKEICWRNNYGQLVATGYVGSSGAECGMSGFDVSFSEAEARELARLGTLGNVERNDSMDDE